MSRSRLRVVRGALTYVEPAFMVPAVGMSAYGGLLSDRFRALPAVLHCLAVALALYVAHLNDGYVDAHVRGEEAPRLPARANRTAVGVGTVLLFLLLGALATTAGPPTAVVTVPLWLLAVLHAPYLDVHPIGVTVDYPLGIGLVVVGGYLAQGNELAQPVVAVALVIAALLAGIKVSIDRLDYAFDRTIGKRTVPVVLGDDAAVVVSAAILTLAAALVAAFVAVGTLPPAAVAASAFPPLAAATGFVCSKETAVRLQMLLTYPFAAALFVAYCSTLACGLEAPLVAYSPGFGGG